MQSTLATVWEQLDRRWINLPAALLIGLVALVTIVPPPSLGVTLPWRNSNADDPITGLSAIDIPTIAAGTPGVAATPPSRSSVASTPVAEATPSHSELDAAALGKIKPNELGGIPIIMYHAFTTNPDYVDEWTLTFDQFREQLDWYREHDFVMVGMQDMITGHFDVPAGKSPIILTFDDSNSGQFGLKKAADGGWEVRANTAVGVLEEYGKTYPEFVGPAFFAILTWNCFASDDDPSTCGERLNWLVDHGYEIGNHTWDHVDMTDVSDDFFVNSIASMTDWLNELVPADTPGNLSDVVVMPFGAYPDRDLHPEQMKWLSEGFWWHGDPFNMPLVLTVNGGPAIPPYAMDSFPAMTFRIASEPGILGYWQDAMTSGEAPVFVSDGEADVITIPAGRIDDLDEEWAANHGLEVRTYEPSDAGS